MLRNIILLIFVLVLGACHNFLPGKKGQTDYLIIGDSFIAGGGAQNNQGWAQMFKTNNPDLNVEIAGVGGDNILKVNNRLAALQDSVFDVVILGVGLNDSRYRPSLSGYEVPLEDFQQGLTAFAEFFRKRNPDVSIFFVGLTRVDESKASPYKPDKYYFNKNIEIFNAKIEATARSLGAGYIEVPYLFEEPENLSDGLHPSSRGHEILLQVISSKVR